MISSALRVRGPLGADAGPQKGMANAPVDCVDRGFIGHSAIVSEQTAALGRMTGNGHKQPFDVYP